MNFIFCQFLFYIFILFDAHIPCYVLLVRRYLLFTSTVLSSSTCPLASYEEAILTSIDDRTPPNVVLFIL